MPVLFCNHFKYSLLIIVKNRLLINEKLTVQFSIFAHPLTFKTYMLCYHTVINTYYPSFCWMETIFIIFTLSWFVGLQWYRFERQGRRVAVSVLVVATWFIALIIAGRSLSPCGMCAVGTCRTTVGRGCSRCFYQLCSRNKKRNVFSFPRFCHTAWCGSAGAYAVAMVSSSANSFHSFVTRHSSFYISVHTFQHFFKN